MILPKQVLNEALDDYIHKVKGNIEYFQNGVNAAEISQTQHDEFRKLLQEQQERLQIAELLKG